MSESIAERREAAVEVRVFTPEDMDQVQKLVSAGLSEPYSQLTYRYFLGGWPELALLAMNGTECVGCVVCKIESHGKDVQRGYIAMLAVDGKCRRLGVGSLLVKFAVQKMRQLGAQEIVLETEAKNKAALKLYQKLGFIRDKRLNKYYMNQGDAFRLKLFFE